MRSLMKPGDADERTRLKYLSPRVDLSDDWIARLREALRARDDIVAAYWLATIYLDADDSPSQDELHFELRDAPDADGAPVELFREISRILPPLDPHGIIFTFTTAHRLPAVRRAGLRVY
jgi:hypothetical protein